jgi:hypothetical protein
VAENALVIKAKPLISTTDAEIDAAIARAAVYDERRPKVVAAGYRAKGDLIVIKLATGVEVAIPRRMMQGLESATRAQLSDVTIVGAQSGLHWEALDVDHYVPALIDGILGTRKWMATLGKTGGVSRSSTKAAAARANGRKGGRPRKDSKIAN